MAMGIRVEIDEKGRVQIPATIRREVKTRRFTLFVKDGKILLEPTKPPATGRGKYKGLLKLSGEELEEAQERFVAAERA